MLTFDVGTKVREKLVIGYILITKNLNDEKKKKKKRQEFLGLSAVECRPSVDLISCHSLPFT